MSELQDSIIKILRTDDEPKPKFLRGNSLAWTTVFPSAARNLGQQLVAELISFKDYSDERILEIGRQLADQEPPMITEMSWGLHDGIHDALKERRAEGVVDV